MRTILHSRFKRKRTAYVVLALCLCLGFSLFGQNAYSQGRIKVQVCHKGKVIIVISESALKAHLAHGDKLGTCDLTPPCTVTATGGVLTCARTEVTLQTVSSVAALSYSWTGPNGFTSTAANPVVSVPGIYTVTASSANCTAFVDTALVTRDLTAPVVTATGGTITCNNPSVNLSASSSINGSTFSWTGPGGFASSSANPTVQAAGTYVVTATNPATGCTAINAAVVQQNLNAPAILTIQASGSGTITCYNPSVVLTATTDATDVKYKWTGPDNFISDSAAPAVNHPGTYKLELSNISNGCASTASIDIMSNTTAPLEVSTIPAVMGTITCSQSSLLLTGGSATAGVRYNWSGPNGFTSSSATTTATLPGVYTLRVTDTTNGCGSEATVSVEQNMVTPVGVTASNSEPLTCFTSEVSLLGSSATEAVSYNWSGPDGFSSSSPITTTSVAGTYTLTVTDLVNGCTSSATTTVIQNTTPPADVTIQTPGIITCSNPSVLLQAASSSTDVDYNWFGPDGYYASTAEATTEYPGDYMLMVTDRTNGCSVIMNTTVEQDVSDCGATRRTAETTVLAESTASAVELNTYPNPVQNRGLISFKIRQSGKVTITIHSAGGVNQQLLFNQQAQANHLYQVELNASKLTRGIYYCVMTVNNKQYSRKIIIMP